MEREKELERLLKDLEEQRARDVKLLERMEKSIRELGGESSRASAPLRTNCCNPFTGCAPTVPERSNQLRREFNWVPETLESNRYLRFEDLERSFKFFYGDNQLKIFSWLEQFSNLADQHRLNNFLRFSFAKRLMRGTARSFVELESRATTWNELQCDLIREFGKRSNSALIYERLRNRKKEKNESAIQYLYNMLAIASQSDMDVGAIITFTVDGLPGTPESKAFMYHTRTLDEFKEKLLGYELVQTRVGDQNEKTERRVQSNRKEENERKIYCYQCGSNSHLVPNCPNKTSGPKCFRCSEFGHISSSCTNVQSTMPRMNIIREVENNEEGSDKEEEDVDEIKMSPEDEERWYKRLYYQHKSREY